MELKQGDNEDSDLSSTDIGDHGIDINNIELKNATDFPIDLDVAAEYQNILAAGILRNSEHIHVYDYICEIIFEGTRTFKLTTILFWIVFCIKFQQNSPEILQDLRAKVGKLYAKHFAKIRSPKEDIANDMIFLFAYCIQVTFYSVFTHNRDKLTMRFILDIYHIVIFELHGLYVSDAYIQSSIEKILGNKFFFYEQKPSKVKSKKKAMAKDKKDEPLLRDLNFNPDSILHVTGGIEFASELSSRLREKKEWFVTQDHGYSSLTLGHSEKPKLNSPTRRATKKSMGKLPEEPAKQNEHEVPEKKGAVYFPQIKFDCTQISPTVSRFLNNPTMSLPFQKKKLISYTINKHPIKTMHYDLPNTIENLRAKKSSKTEQEKAVETQFQIYSLKNRPNDYALSYLPPTDKFQLKKRFKDEIDLKYILDNVGTFSILPTSHQNADEHKRESATKQYHHHRTSSVSGNFYSGQTIFPEMEVPKQPQNENILKLETERPQDRGDTDIKRNSLRESAVSKFLSETERNSYADARKKTDLAVDIGLLTSSRTKETEEQTHPTPLLTPSNPVLFKKLAKTNRKIQIFHAFKLSEPIPQTERRESHTVKAEVSAPMKKLTLNIQDLSRKAKANHLLDEDDKHREARKNEKDFVYEDKRKQYTESHARLFTKSVDKNINDLVRKLAQKQTFVSKSVPKFAKNISK